jgi:hypothetical protein
MQRQPKSKVAVAITAALELEPTHALFREAQRQVEATCAIATTSKEACELMGGVAPATWCRWKRRIGLEVKQTNPGRQHAGQ